MKRHTEAADAFSGAPREVKGRPGRCAQTHDCVRQSARLHVAPGPPHAHRVNLGQRRGLLRSSAAAADSARLAAPLRRRGPGSLSPRARRRRRSGEGEPPPPASAAHSPTPSVARPTPSPPPGPRSGFARLLTGPAARGGARARELREATAPAGAEGRGKGGKDSARPKWGGAGRGYCCRKRRRT